ncbi:MAG: hypothetical protein H0U02_02855, partial [Rubrobacter sp.]|nr:hypothetical protein [Rubrobacter sp.]
LIEGIERLGGDLAEDPAGTLAIHAAHQRLLRHDPAALPGIEDWLECDAKADAQPFARPAG